MESKCCHVHCFPAGDVNSNANDMKACVAFGGEVYHARAFVSGPPGMQAQSPPSGSTMGLYHPVPNLGFYRILKTNEMNFHNDVSHVGAIRRDDH